MCASQIKDITQAAHSFQLSLQVHGQQAKVNLENLDNQTQVITIFT